jgi:plastocyanin
MSEKQRIDERTGGRSSLRAAGIGLLVATTLLVAACGSSNNDNSSTSAQTSPAATNTTTTSTTAGGTSASTGASSVSLAPQGNNLAFDANTETAKAGKVAIKFTNNSALQHNVTLVNSSNKILGKTPTFQGGTKSFSATLSPGTYTYYCSVPGHRQAGMQGTLTVK